MKRTPSSPTAIRLDPKLAKAAKRTAAVTGKTVTQLTNQGLELLLAKRELALKLARTRRNGPMRDYDEVVAELRRDGLL